MRLLLLLCLIGGIHAGLSQNTPSELRGAIQSTTAKLNLAPVVARLHTAGFPAFFNARELEPGVLSLDWLSIETSTTGALGKMQQELAKPVKMPGQRTFEYTLPQLISLAPGFNWEEYFQTRGFAPPKKIQLVPPLIRRLEEQLVLNSLDTIKAYLLASLDPPGTDRPAK